MDLKYCASGRTVYWHCRKLGVVYKYLPSCGRNWFVRKRVNTQYYELIYTDVPRSGKVVTRFKVLEAALCYAEMHEDLAWRCAVKLRYSRITRKFRNTGK